MEDDIQDLKSKREQGSGIDEETIREAEERTRRRKYLIVSGAQESGTGTLEERKQHDRELVKDLFREIGVHDFHPEGIHRIGPIQSAKPRLLRFKCSDQEERSECLRKSKLLRNSPKFAGVYVNPDYTKAQRTKNIELRKELKARRNAGEKVVIRHGCIINPGYNQGFHQRF